MPHNGIPTDIYYPGYVYHTAYIPYDTHTRSIGGATQVNGSKIFGSVGRSAAGLGRDGAQ